MSEDTRTTVNVLDGFISRCSIDRGRQPPVNATIALSLSVKLLDAPSNSLEATLTAVVTPSETAGDAVNASVSFVLTLAEVLTELPNDLARAILQLAWPYLRSALDIIAGLARVPSLALPIAPPNFTGNTQESVTQRGSE